MNFQTSHVFDLLDFLSFSLSDYLQSKLSFLEGQMITSHHKQSHFEIVLDFSLTFIDFVKRILFNNGIRKPASHLVQLIERNFLNELDTISNSKDQYLKEKPISLLLRTKIDKISAYKFQMVMRFLLLKNLFEAEMILKDQASTSTKQKVKKELIKLLDMVRINMQTEGEDFLSFFMRKIFEHVKDSNSLNFHNFLLDLSKICELPDEIFETCSDNIQNLRKKNKERTNPPPIAKISENVLNCCQHNNNNHNIDQNSNDKTLSTVMNDDVFKYSFPTSLSNFIEKDLINPEIVKQTKKEPNSPTKTSFSLDPTRKKIFNDITLNNQKNKNDLNSLLNQNKTNNFVSMSTIQIPEESDSRSSSMISTNSNHNYENMNRNLNNSILFNKPKVVRNFGTTFGRKMVQLPLNRKGSGVFKKKNQSIFDHFISEVNDKLIERQMSKETCNFFQKSLNIKENDDDDNSDLPDLLSWNNVVAFNTPIKEEYKSKNMDEFEILSYKSMLKEIN